MTWAITYRAQDWRGTREHTLHLDPAWCTANSIDHDELTTPEHAAWYAALTLGNDGQTDAELITIKAAP